MGLSLEVAGEWVRGCISERELVKLSALIESRLAELAAKDRAKVAKRARLCVKANVK